MEKGTTEEFSVVQKEGNRNVRRAMKFYNLDVILSVGCWRKMQKIPLAQMNDLDLNYFVIVYLLLL